MKDLEENPQIHVDNPNTAGNNLCITWDCSDLFVIENMYVPISTAS